MYTARHTPSAWPSRLQPLHGRQVANGSLLPSPLPDHLKVSFAHTCAHTQGTDVLPRPSCAACTPLQVKAACPWPVTPPPVALDASTAKPGDWYIPVLPRAADGTGWRSPVLKAPWAGGVRASLYKMLPHNLPGAVVWHRNSTVAAAAVAAQAQTVA
jgi:hypothetical protein